MFGLFNNKPKALLGIDISSNSIKVIQLSCEGGQYRLEAFGSDRLPEGAVVENTIQNTEVVGNAISKAVARSRSNLNDVAVAVTGAAVITKMIEMDASLSDGEMESQIAVEADQYIPYALDEVAIDFEVQSLNADNPQRAEVLLAACRKDSVESLEEVLEIAGLNAAVVDIEAFAMERAFELLEGNISLSVEEPAVAVVDIGSDSTSLYVLIDGKTVYTREQPFGGQQLIDEVQRHYEFTQDEAVQAVKQGTLPEDYESELLRPFRDATVQQISRSLQFFYSSSQHSQVDAIALAGGTALISGLVPQLQKELGGNVFLANPFADMSFSGKINTKELTLIAPSLMVACGLAMRSFD
ncbi:pilus assembly protein PilM [Endozoicomonas sp. Mp262]|uniref:pilus assembly protein PilM n=1 Tax=Endozoicomonas sp. Mp262 TaxID=2919499 RepID=UPI0021DAE3A3